MIEELLKEITDWQDSVFTEATPLSAAKHLRTEVKELINSLTYDPDEVNTEHLAPYEIADCFLLIVAVANLSGIDLLAAAKEKLEINKQRTWGEVNEEGFVEHVRKLGVDSIFQDGNSLFASGTVDFDISKLRIKLDGDLPG